MKIENLILFLWFLGLFKPEWILSHYIPGFAFIKALPTFFLYGTFLYVFVSGSRKLVIDKPYLFFFFSILLSAFFAENTGIGRQALRGVADPLIFFVLCTSLLNNEKTIDKLFNLYMLSFVFYGILGVIYKGLIPFHLYFRNEDAFGPFMVIAVPFSFYLAYRHGEIRYRDLLVTLLCIIGVIVSFARGAFVSLFTAGIFIWYKFNRKIIITLIMCLLAVFFVFSTNILFRENQYWKEMSTISKSIVGDQSELNEDRHFLIKKGWEMFINNPVFGVGPFNYGFIYPRIISSSEAEDKKIGPVERLYYRVPHNIYIQILAELGTIGAIAFTFIIYSFWRKNREIQNSYKKRFAEFQSCNQTDIFWKSRKNYYYAIAVEGAMVAYLISGLFYDILYYPWFVSLLILNSLIQRNTDTSS